MENEQWRPIVGYEDIYSVSDRGRIRRNIGKLHAGSGGNNCFAGAILKCAAGVRGYRVVTLYRNTNKKQCYVHHVVAEAFIGPRQKNLVINHKNGDKTDNRPLNLEWITKAENVRHAFRTRLMPVGSSNYKAKLTDEDVRYIRAHYRPGMNRYRDFANIHGVSVGTISKIIRNEKWRHVVHHE